MKGLVEAIEKENMKTEVPAFNVGDTVKVGFKVIEGTKERIQNFEGVVIAKKHGGMRELYCKASFVRSRRGENFPRSLAQDYRYYRCKKGQGKKSKTLLPQRSYR